MKPTRPADPRLRRHALDQLDAPARGDLEKLLPHDQKIREALRDDALRELFVRDPVRALAKAGVKVPPGLAARLKGFDASGFLGLGAREYLLPNGQVLRPRIRVRFTEPEGKEG
jgi:hypothetical protein